MSIALTLPLLVELDKRMETEPLSLRKIDLYAAEYGCRNIENPEERECAAFLLFVLSWRTGFGQLSLNTEDIESVRTQLGIARKSLVKNDWLGYLKSVAWTDELHADDLSDSPEAGGVIADGHCSDNHLVLVGNELILKRYWRVQSNVDDWLASRAKLEVIGNEQLTPIKAVHRYCFPAGEGDDGDLEQDKNRDRDREGTQELDWQAMAAAQALLSSVTLVSGGPGTGKTTTAARLLFCLIAQWRIQRGYTSTSEPWPRIALLAPTGKAAARLNHAIRYECRRLEQACPATLDYMRACSQALPEHGSTLHRFLGSRGPQGVVMSQTDYHAVVVPRISDSEEPADLIVVDEASMIDLALMEQLTLHIPQSSKVVFLGDHYQLPSVEVGAVFAHWVSRYQSRPQHTQALELLSSFTRAGLPATMYASEVSKEPKDNDNRTYNPLCQLRKTYRFTGSLADIATIIRQKSADEFVGFFKDKVETEPDHSVYWHNLSGSEAWTPELLETLMSGYRDYFTSLDKHDSPAALAEAFSRFQILCCGMNGPMGVLALNAAIEAFFGRDDTWYHGKAVLVTRNDFQLGIFNGDIGFAVASDGSSHDKFGNGNFDLVFPDREGEAFRVPVSRVQHWLPAYAMTVHKSQGSEYQDVSVLLAESMQELLSRPLLYTALTRARERCSIWASQEAIARVFSR